MERLRLNCYFFVVNCLLTHVRNRTILHKSTISYMYLIGNKESCGGRIMNVEMKKFNNIAGTINSIYHDAALKMGMTDSERDILYVICDLGSGCNQSALYKNTGMTRSTVNSALRKMEKAGILYVKSGEGRNTCVYLTEYGEKYLSSTVGKIVEIENKIFTGWSKKEQELFIALNERYAEQLNHELTAYFKEKNTGE